ncbi:MAG: enoyl-CoA hydratase/isomerase family protein [Labilithrix sp.]|nr:enoyl-CoA hydratase/isomerase family protein [Labilithrix sp.]
MLDQVAPSGPASARLAPIVTTERRADGVAVLTLDDPAEAHNTITPALAGELSAAVEAAFADEAVRAVVLWSGKKDSFVVGANIDFVRSIRFALDAEEASREVARRFERLGAGPKPVVAYVHGTALGGGFELALACTASVATEDAKTALGLPEVKLGLLPAANGLLRIAERAGLRVALDLGLTGKRLRPAAALRLGLVDDVVPAAVGLDTAVRLASRLAEEPGHARALAKKRRRRGVGDQLGRALLEDNPLGRLALFRKVRAETLKKTRGHYPAAERIVDLLARFASRGFRAGAELEPCVFGDLVVSDTAHRLIDLFFAETALKKSTGLAPNERAAAFPVEHVAVLGAGFMGAGIAAVSARAGLDVRMKDTDDAAVGRGLRYVKELLDSRARKGSMSARDRDAAFGRLSGAIDYSGLRNADVVIEAVFEDLALKHSVIRDVERRVRDTCVIASNTSSIPIARIAEASSRPEMIVGMHYFSPVHQMPLLEVIRTKASDPRAVATAVALGKRQGKTVIVVNDGPGFYTTRILVPYLNEAAHLLAEGVSIADVDAAMVDWGFPVGPFQLMDEVGIDVGAHVGEVTEAAFGERMRPPPAFAALRADDRRGKKNARGFYLYGSAAPRKKTVDPTVYDVLGISPKVGAVSSEEITLRCGLAMVNEAFRCLGEGVVAGARDGDVGAIFGVGFPAFRGGPLRYADVLGLPEVLRRVRSLEQRFGARFEPAPLLVEMARAGRRLYE